MVLAADGAELARLEKPSSGRDAGRRRLAGGLERLGLAPRTVISERTPIGSVVAERRVGRLPRRRIVYDSPGAGVATITMTLPLTGIHRFYVIDLEERIDEPLRAVALLTPFLWDSYTIAWETGG
jgi:hypothetical protein